ncbi:MAG: glycosyltransferase family 4 protein, partial [Chloroflexota bacterium]
MRIAIDCRIAAYTPGGTAVYACNLVAALASLAWPPDDRVLLLEARRRKRPLLTALPAGFGSRRLATPSHHRLEQWLLPLELLASPIDLLHSTDFIPPFIRRCRSVITVHDLAFLRWPHLLTKDSRRYFNQQIAHAVRSSDRIIAVSEATRQDLIDLLAADPAKIDVVYEAADASMAPEPNRAVTEAGLKRLGLGGDFLLFVGTLEPRKNVPVLLGAFRALVDAGYDGMLVLAGARGWLYEDVFRAVEALNLGQCVRLVEHFSHAELRHLYN